MQFLDLAPELVHQILLEAVLTRGILRFLTLKLVCKRFCHDVQFALFESHLLDDYNTWGLVTYWHMDRSRRACNFWHPYLIHRVQNNSDSCPPQFRHIRRIVETLCAETGDDVKTTIETLCWPALRAATHFANNKQPSYFKLDFESDLLCAATYLNIVPVVKRLLQGKLMPKYRRFLFGSPMLLAASTGHKYLLEYLQEKMLQMPSDSDRQFAQYDSIRGAAMSGDLEMVRTALYPSSWSTIDNMNFIDGQFIPQSSFAGAALIKAQKSTGNLEMYKYLEGFFPQPTECPSEKGLRLHIHLGHFEIVKYILDTTATFFLEFIRVSGSRHQDVNDFLLERGLNLKFARLDELKSKWMGDNIIPIEDQERNILLVQMLLDRGASIFEVRTADHALRWAIWREDTFMVKMLLASGIDLPSCGGFLLSFAVIHGLDSMKEILQAEFFKLSKPQRARWMMTDGRIDPEKHEP
ncbi:hypothetical protein H4I95_07280 [Botrytis cinerea]